MFGHYEDADLCLKSLRAGVPAWLHDLQMWHLEGKGSLRLPQHEGGSLLNRWLFSRTWEAAIIPELVGRTPGHALLRSQPFEQPTPAGQTAPESAAAPATVAAKRIATRRARPAGR
jgi:hypothetical protein